MSEGKKNRLHFEDVEFVVLGDNGLELLRGTCKYGRCEREKNREGNYIG